MAVRTRKVPWAFENAPHGFNIMLASWSKFMCFISMGRKSEYFYSWLVSLPSRWNPETTINQQKKSDASHNSFRHWCVRFYAFVRQPFSRRCIFVNFLSPRANVKRKLGCTGPQMILGRKWSANQTTNDPCGAFFESHRKPSRDLLDQNWF